MSISPSITRSITRSISSSLGGDQKAIFPGSSGDNISTPDSVANSITGDIDINATFTGSVSGVFRALVAKWGTSQTAYRLLLTDGNFPQLRWSTDGTAQVVSTSTVVYPSIGTKATLRSTLDVSTGEVKFYVDGSLLDTVAGAGATSIFDSTAIVELGSRNSGTAELFTGSIFSAQIFNGIDGTLAVDFNANDYAQGSTLTSKATGETYTINGNVTITRA